MSGLLAVAGLSARLLAEAARDGGYRPLALDLFGDADTRRAAEDWFPVGAPARLAIEGDALLAALRRAKALGARGWIAGSGFEAAPELLGAGARVLPLIGNAPELVASVRTPAVFYDRLAVLGIPHPATAMARPALADGWLRKDARSSGGWHVRPVAGAGDTVVEDAKDAAAAPGIYYQRVAAGEPMSALFLADGRNARLVGISRQIVRRLGGRPYVFRGCVGPVTLPPPVQRELGDVVDVLAAEFGLRGLNGIDFMLEGERFAVLELNPRPSASMALYRRAVAGGLVRAHIQAAAEARLPAGDGRVAAGAGCRGFEVVFASRAGRLDTAALATLAAEDWCHDVPSGAAVFAWGEPVCTVSAFALTAAEAQAQLARRRRQIRSLLEQLDE